ncbi:MAG: response regulator transcription factor [Flavobacteriales bacterium]|nr:response regulator transcription factor [Flavobacteriales bacterium]
MKILVVEDEPKVAAFISQGLQENGYSTEIAYDGATALRMHEASPYEFYIIDINLPEKNGLQLCRDIRKTNQVVPILMLTALGTTEDKIAGFESGADDYLVKPFEFRELLVRIKALLKRTNSENKVQNILRVADLELNLDNYKVTRAGKRIELTGREFALLELLMKNKGRVLPRSEIAEKVWSVTFDTGTNVIDVYVTFLRKKVDKDFSPKLIHTQTGVGYILTEDTQ